MPVATEFLCFRGILRNSVMASNKGTNSAHFGRFQVAILYVYVIFAMKYMTADGAVIEGMLKLLISAYLKYSKFICFRQLYFSVAVTGDKCCIFVRVQRP